MGEYEALNPGGQVFFLKREISRMRDVGAVCGEIGGREGSVNSLFLSVGTLQGGFGELAGALAEGIELE